VEPRRAPDTKVDSDRDPWRSGPREWRRGIQALEPPMQALPST